MDISHWITRWADFQPNKTAIRFEGVDISYAGFDKQIGRVAAMLSVGLNVERGDRIAFLGLNSPQMLAMMFACARIGAILVPLNWRLAPPEHAYILKNAGVKVLFCEEEFAEGTASIADDLADCRIVYMYGEYGHLLEAAGADAQVPTVGSDDPLLIV